MGQGHILVESQPPRNYTRLAVAIVIAALVTSASALAYASLVATVTKTATSTSNDTTIQAITEATTVLSTTTVESTPALYASNISQGLQLQVALNSSSIAPHGEVAAQIELVNTLDHNVSLTVVQNKNISQWNGEDFFCGDNPSQSLVGFALFSGRFSAENISTAGSPPQLSASSMAVPCGISLPLNGTTFLPDSDKTLSFSDYGQTQEPSGHVTAEVNATTGHCLPPVSYETTSTLESCPEASGIIGYWNASFGQTGNATFSSPDFTYLPSGVYTMVAADDWNQTLYVHFQVSGSTPPAECPSIGTLGSSFGQVTASTTYPAFICVQLYYYNSPFAAMTLNLTAALSIQGVQENNPNDVLNGASNFTISASPSQINIGGPKNESEGTIVVYTITENPGASGTYWLGFLQSSGLSGYLVTPQEPTSCGSYGELIAGSGQPDYAQGLSGCITIPTTTQTSSSITASVPGYHTIPGIPYLLPDDNIYFTIVGIGSSTSA